MEIGNTKTDKLLSCQDNFIKLISSAVFMNSISLAVGDFINLKEFLTLRFIEQFSVKQLSEYYNVSTYVIENWLGKIYRITEVLIRKKFISFD